MGFLVNRTARLFRRLADRRLEPLRLSAGHLPVLTALMASDALSQKALTAQAGIEQPTMAATLSRMERDGIIERHPDPEDGRSFLFSLTAATRRKVAAIQAVVAQMSNDALAGLTDEERKRTRLVLEGLITALEKALGE
jgi:MarR family transcriptional regulator, transcriptional regulator for hemolysin